jgi:hypothetical protein
MSETSKTPAPRAHPLQWPPGWPKTAPKEKQQGVFKSTISSALTLLRTEISRFGGTNVVLSSNFTLGNESPKETGVVAYFLLDGQQMAIPCDRWYKIEHNIQAIALTIEAIRGMDRWGAKNMIKAVLQGFLALPERSTVPDWWDVLECRRDSPLDVVRAQYKRLAHDHHPDHGGSAGKMSEVNAAWATAQKELAA